MQANGQECNCPLKAFFVDDANVKRTFLLGIRSIAVCGDRIIEGTDTVYSEFSLFECGNDTTLKEWGVLEPCRINMVKDTVYVNQLYFLPIGKNLAYSFEPFYIYKYWYQNNLLHKKQSFNTALRKYSKAEIEEVFKQHAKLKRGNVEENVNVADMLFWAYVSGNKKAELYFNKIETDFGPFDGYISEEWHKIQNTYLFYKRDLGLN